jgi:hypothetical protein
MEGRMNDNAGFFGMAAAVLGGGVRQYAAHQAELERLTMSLATVVGPDGAQAAQDEVERRRDMFARTWTESPRPGELPDVAALKSVLDDVVTGRWLL